MTNNTITVFVSQAAAAIGALREHLAEHSRPAPPLFDAADAGEAFNEQATDLLVALERVQRIAGDQLAELQATVGALHTQLTALSQLDQCCAAQLRKIEL